MVKTLYLTRHAQAEHKIGADLLTLVPDAKLTALGKKQSRELYDITKDTFQKTAELIVSSCQVRPLETMVIGYADLKKRLEAEGKPVVVMDLLQEVGPYPCDIPTYPPSAIASALGGIFSDLDFSGLSEGYASKEGIFAPANVEERAASVRKWLAERPEQEIVGEDGHGRADVVVAHGDILRQIADGSHSARPWGNAEVKVFTFKEGSHSLVEVAKVEPKSETHAPTSSEM